MRLIGRGIRFGFSIFTMVACGAGMAAGGELYRWTDENGSMHVADSLSKVPPKYRSKFKSKAKPQAKPQPDPLPLSPQEALSADGRKVEIPLRRMGNVIAVPAVLNDKLSVELIVDTGASTSVISPGVAEQLGINLDGSHPNAQLQTANGSLQVPIIQLQSISVGGLVVRGTNALVHKWHPDPSRAGLLGLDFLSHFKMDINTKKGVLVLELKDESVQGSGGASPPDQRD